MNDLEILEISLLGISILIFSIIGGVVIRTRQLDLEGQINQHQFVSRQRQEDVLRRQQGGTRKRNRLRKNINI